MTLNRERGFSLIEFLVVIIVLLVMTATVFAMITGSMARSGTEQAKLDMFQAGREFMDQMSRDLHQGGYPNVLNFVPNYLAIDAPTDARNAVGLVMIDEDDLWFEGDVDGGGVVSVIHYHLDTSTTNGCPCLKRSQLPKIDGEPLTGQTAPSYQVEVQGVKNTDIFSAYIDGATGTPITLPVDFDNDGDVIATIDTIQAVLTLESPWIDPQTKQKPISTLVTTVRLNNCSQAASGLPMSCQ